MTANEVVPIQPADSTVVVAADGSVTVTQGSNAVTVTSAGTITVPFSPLDLSPTLWLDASDETTITESGGAVSQWDDKSTNGNNYSQGTAANQPATGTRTINSLNTLDFDGTSDILLNSPVTVSGAQPVTIFGVAEPDTVHYGPLLRFGGNSSELTVGYITLGRFFERAGTLVTSAQSLYSGGNVYLTRFILNSTSSTMHVNGSSIFSGNAGTTDLSNRTVAELGSGAGQYFNGKIGELIVCAGSTLTAQEISDTETYLADKWGITL